MLAVIDDDILPNDSPEDPDDYLYLLCDFNTNNNSNDSKLDSSACVVNLSSYTLNEDEIRVLKRGLKFCPTPGEPNFGDLRENLNKFNMRLGRQLFFSSLPEEESDDEGRPRRAPINNQDDGFGHTKFREPSKWKPPPVTSLELFIRQNEMDLLSHGIPPNKFHNLSKGEKLAIKTLSSNKNIIIKPADKGGAVVVQDVLDYINEGIRQLSDTNFYIETQEDLTHQHTLDINAFLTTMSESKEIDNKCYEYLYVSKERTFLYAPKEPKNPPGRPIVLGNGCPTERISQSVDFFLQPAVKLLPSYVQDTTHFLTKLDNLGNIPPGSWSLWMSLAYILIYRTKRALKQPSWL